MIKEFSKNSEKFNMQQEMMADTMDMAMGDADADTEADDVYNQILEEQGLSEASNNGMAVGTGAIGAPQQIAQPQAAENTGEVDDMQKRLDALNEK